MNNTIVLDRVNTTTTWVVCLSNTFVLDFITMKYGERLRSARKHKGYSQTQLHKESGVGQGTISKIERGDQETSTFDIELADALDVDPRWLKTGDEKFAPEWLNVVREKESAEYVMESNAEEARRLGELSKVPVVGTAQLGDDGYWAELEYPVGHGDGYIKYPTRDPNAYALLCRGDSMRPRIKEGEYVIVEPNSEPIPGEEVLVKAIDGRVMVKIFLYQRGDKIRLMSINETHPPQDFSLSEIEKIHFVAGIAKKALWTDEYY